MKDVCLHDEDLWCAVEFIAWKWACLFHLPMKGIVPFPAHGTSTTKGWNDPYTGVISVAVRYSNDGIWEEKPLGALVILDTIAHELAHFRHGKENRKHRKFTKEILDDMVEAGALQELLLLRSGKLDKTQRRVLT